MQGLSEGSRPGARMKGCPRMAAAPVFACAMLALLLLLYAIIVGSDVL